MLEFIDLALLGGLAPAALGLSAVGAAWSWCRGSRALSVGTPVGRQRPRLTRVGPYVLLERLGAGAMGVVYRARHAGSGQLCAVKLLPRHAGERERRQFDNEARFGASLRHPNTVAVYEEGRTADGTRFFAMELVEGISLQELVDQHGPQPASRVIPILVQVCAALAAAHEQGFVHRDIKPSNIVLSSGAQGEEVAKLLDFGLVKDAASPPAPAGRDEPVVGTPLYISPEAITTPGAVDARSDLYGLGAVAHFLLSGAPVFNGQTVIEVCSQHLLAAPEPLSHIVGWTLAADLEKIILDCLAKEPAARPASARELAGRLARCADAEWSSPPAFASLPQSFHGSV